MARLSLLAFVALALSSIASGAPTPDGVNEEGAEIPTASWMYQTPRFSKQKRV